MDGDDPAWRPRDLVGRRALPIATECRLVVRGVGEPSIPRTVHRPSDAHRPTRTSAHSASPWGHGRPASVGWRPMWCGWRWTTAAPPRRTSLSGLTAAAAVACDRPIRWAVVARGRGEPLIGTCSRSGRGDRTVSWQPRRPASREARPLLRFVERLCLRRVSLLVLSSPGFHRNYSAAIQKYAGKWHLLENKLYPPPSSSPVSARSVVGRDRPWVVGY